jgi:hypothetical protein
MYPAARMSRAHLLTAFSATVMPINPCPVAEHRITSPLAFTNTCEYVAQLVADVANRSPTRTVARLGTIGDPPFSVRQPSLWSPLGDLRLTAILLASIFPFVTLRKKLTMTAKEMQSLGGKARAKSLSAKRRKEIAIKASRARWRRKKKLASKH